MTLALRGILAKILFRRMDHGTLALAMTAGGIVSCFAARTCLGQVLRRSSARAR